MEYIENETGIRERRTIHLPVYIRGGWILIRYDEEKNSGIINGSISSVSDYDRLFWQQSV